MKRRRFITQSTMAIGATSLPLNLDWNLGKKYKLGYQLYSIRDEMAKDAVSTLKNLKSMGYEDFEVYGYNADLKTYYGYSGNELASILEDLEVSVSSGHYAFAPFIGKGREPLMRFVDNCIEGALAIKSKYITWPWMAPEQRNLESFKIMADMLNIIGEQVYKAGLGFAYHNHGFEFKDHGGENAFEIILKETDENLVKLQMDMYWIMHEGQTTPKALVDKHQGRFVMWHIKDMDVLTRDYTELGNGSINYLNVLPNPEKSGLEYFYIEQGGNFAKNSTQSASTSAKYFKNHLTELINS